MGMEHHLFFENRTNKSLRDSPDLILLIISSPLIIRENQRNSAEKRNNRPTQVRNETEVISRDTSTKKQKANCRRSEKMLNFDTRGFETWQPSNLLPFGLLIPKSKKSNKTNVYSIKAYHLVSFRPCQCTLIQKE